jgi:hypothetical protein
MLNYLEAQKALLYDRNRIDAYVGALRAVVRPGDVVLDLGAGSGLLGWLALQAGAAHVVAVDDSANVHVLREVVARQGLTDRVTVHEVNSMKLQLAQPVDLVVCDQAGPLGWEGGLLEVLHDARERLLRDDGRLMPSAMQTWIAPSHRPRVTAALQTWLEPVSGLDVSFLADWSANDIWTVDAAEEGGPQAEAQSAARWQLGTDPGRVPTVSDLSWSFAGRGVVSGFEGWFHSTLCEGHPMTNGPAARPVSRSRRFLPLRSPLDVREGDEVRLRLLMRPSGRLIQWSGDLRRDDRITARFSCDNFAALLRQGRRSR